MGNKIGWLLAGVVVVGVIVAIIVVFGGPSLSTSKPTSATTNKGVLDKHEISLSPALVAGFEPSGGGDAGDDYAAASKLYEETKQVLLAAKPGNWASFDPKAVEALKAIHGHVAAGARKKNMTYILRLTGARFTGGTYFNCPAAQDMQNVNSALVRLADYYKGIGQVEQAQKVLQDAFILGWHIMQERALACFVQRGLGLQERAIERLLSLYASSAQHASSIDDCKRYRVELAKVRSRFSDKEAIFTPLRAQPGDVFNVIENDKDRAWRIQAIVSLGVLKRTAGKPGDVKYTAKLIERFAASSDPLEAAAGRFARDMTEADF